ncbi:DUF58 domain-containing protein [Botrimarina mediterranea]|uniref:DUF58 domain-containing protein n=1 Tax=Botrimarina mediterranea TaxID=2528022 RepID=A0A518K2E8_9BACT|nr:DUF58 domain-containing protein [Botrimarina mediterranea]QDV71952.1 hypothetical protein Spa11_01210 [Botrimarina mediterranea]QDV76493.1 hypothetical protein K2D_00710 [Planctomycetes bacterium K2D]
MTIRPGKNLVYAGVALAISTVAAFFWLPAVIIVASGVLTLLLACVYDYRSARQVLDTIEVKRNAPRVVGRDLPFSIRYSVVNRRRMAIEGELRDLRSHEANPNDVRRLFSVPPQGQTELVDTVRVPVRGMHTFGPIWLRTWGAWRLVEAQTSIDSLARVKVLPETFASREELIKDIGAAVRLLDQVKTVRQTGAGAEFDSLYPYQYGDDPRRIDWRATARARQPIVRHYQVERHRDVMLVVDCGRLMAGDAGRGAKLDRAIDSALHLAGVALRGGDRCGVGVFDDRVRGYLPPVSGVSSLQSIVESLYAARTEWRESDFTRMFAELQFRQPKRSLVVILSDLSDRETSDQLRSALTLLAQRHLVLFAAVRTPMLSEQIAGPLESIEDGARKAVAMRLVRERRESLHALERGGVQVLDVEPRQLTLPLINRFLVLRGGTQL